MPSLAAATRSNASARRRRLVAGLGLVLGGALLIGLGAAGTVSDTPRTGLLIGGLAVLASLAVLAARAPLRQHERVLVAIGAVIGAASSLFVWSLTPAGVLGRPTLTAAGTLGYLAGVAVMIAALLAGVTMDLREPFGSSSGSTISWTRSHPDTTRQVADGGTTDDRSGSPEDD